MDDNQTDESRDKYLDLEAKLASCLQHHRLASFKPRILALALVSLEFEKQQAHEPEMNADWLASISHLQQLAKVKRCGLERDPHELLVCLGGERRAAGVPRSDRALVTLVQGRAIGARRLDVHLPCI